MQLGDYKIRFKTLLEEVPPEDTGAWIYAESFKGLVDRVNRLICSLNSSFGIDVPMCGIQDSDYSSSHKTIHPPAVKRLKTIINYALELIDSRIQQEEENKKLKFHCFKVGVRCPHDLEVRKNSFFIGMPFSRRFHDIYEYGIKTTFSSYGIESFRADESICNIDVMCKICQGIQKSEYVLIDMSEANANVMFELGLAYGMGKYALLIKGTDSDVPTDLRGLEYIEYTHAKELSDKLRKWLSGKGIV